MWGVPGVSESLVYSDSNSKEEGNQSSAQAQKSERLPTHNEFKELDMMNSLIGNPFKDDFSSEEDASSKSGGDLALFLQRH